MVGMEVMGGSFIVDLEIVEVIEGLVMVVLEIEQSLIIEEVEETLEIKMFLMLFLIQILPL